MYAIQKRRSTDFEALKLYDNPGRLKWLSYALCDCVAFFLYFHVKRSSKDVKEISSGLIGVKIREISGKETSFASILSQVYPLEATLERADFLNL